MKQAELKDQVRREADAVQCPCGGYAKRVEATMDEEKKYGCGKPSVCCARAFVCVICKTRLVGRADAPEME